MAEITIRNQIINYLMAKAEAMVDDSGERLWNKVMLGEPSGNFQEMPILALDPGNDKVQLQDKFRTHKVVVVSMSFRWSRSQIANVDNYQQFEYYLGRLIPAFLPDDRLGGLAIELREAGSGPEIEGRDDPQPGGYLLLEVVYRHGRTNPAKTLDTA